MKWNNECDTCHNEPTCFDTPTDNCRQYKNYDVDRIDAVIARLNAVKEEIKQMTKHEAEIVAQAKAEGAKEFSEYLIKNMFNGNDTFWRGDTPHYKPLRMEDFLAEWQKEQK